jgi:protein-L-isoaspartate(D-aspartate) O-methyltransferase
MYNVYFILDNNTIKIQSKENDLMKNICKSFSTKVQIDLNNLILSCNGKGGQELLNKNITLKQILNEENRKSKEINILAYRQENEESNNSNLNINNEIKKKYSYSNLNINNETKKQSYRSNLNNYNEIKRKSFCTIDNEREDNSKKYHKLLSENRNLSSANLRLKTDLNTLETKNERLKTEKKRLDEKNDELSEINTELSEENEELKKANKDLSYEIKQLRLDSQKRKSFSITDTETEENKRKLELIGLTFELGIDKETNICTKYNHGYKCLIMHLIQSNYIRTEKVLRAMLEVDRNDFAPKFPYDDRPISIGYNVTISAPHMHALALEYLSDYCTKGAKILDVGSGSGFLTVALSKMTNDSGTVVGIDHISQLYNFGRQNIRKHHSELIRDGKVVLALGDGRKGYKKYGPYKAIHVGACSEEVPKELLNQLDYNGRMFIPVGKRRETQHIYIVDKNSYGKITCKSILSVCYGMLTDIDSQLNQ